jgi:DNA-binding MarR family transcriptional regulator
MEMATGEKLGIAAALVRTSFLVQAVYAEASREYGLSAQQGVLLCVLMAEPRGMGELSGMLGLEKSSLTGLVDRAVRRELVRREPDPQDRRAVRVALTTEGRMIVDMFYPDTCRRMEALAAGLDDADRGTLATLLGHVVLENRVPVVFMEPDEEAAAARGR